MRVASQTLGRTQIVVMRELTKLHEEILRGTAEEILSVLQARDAVKGEIIVVVEGSGRLADEVDLKEAVSTLIQEGYSGKKLADEARRRYGVRKSAAYALFLEMKKSP